ncbi:hypothetical protein FSP39_022448 [Pinctada imbricata]|uniref:BHLH domain-containing protein n=1 Tax=Pinctada imbricata TaxID=66713 RepID=A0AA89BQM5_PINIB|nr:hypothetical protein FSP39_022448 [Pinctada imbricata]
MGDSDDDLFSFATTNELPEYPFQFENSNFGPERSSPKCRQTIIPGNAARERTRVKTLRGAFLELQRTLPAVPPDTKLSKLDVLVLATTYIAHLMRTLNEGVDDNQLFAAHGIMHPVKVCHFCVLNHWYCCIGVFKNNNVIILVVYEKQ